MIEIADDTTITPNTKVKLTKTFLAIHGMTCSNCSESIINVVKDIPGVIGLVEISLMTETGLVEHDENIVKADQIVEAIEDCGFDATIQRQEPMYTSTISTTTTTTTSTTGIPGTTTTTTAIIPEETVNITLKIFGMTCSNCSNSIESTLEKLEGVINCQVSLTTEEAFVVYRSNAIGIRDIVTAIEDCGFDCLVNNNSMEIDAQIETLAKIREVLYWRRCFIQCLFIGGPVVLFGHLIPSFMSKYHHHHHAHAHNTIFGPMLFPGMYLDHMCEFILASYLQFVVGYRFYISSYKSLKHGSGTMDLLICISTSIAYFYSVFSMIYAICEKKHETPDVLFATSSMLFIFISLGKWIENKVKGHTSTALSKLLSLQPSTCNLCENFNENLTNLIVKPIAVEYLQIGDILQITPGAKIPTDGVVIYGEGDVDESLLTGESMPVSKTLDSKLIGGSVNGDNVFYLQVTQVGEKTELQQIVKLVKNAQLTKAPIQRYADSIASVFVPTILSLSAFTFIIWTIILWAYYVNNWPYPEFFQNGDIFKKLLTVSISVVVVACPCALGLAAPTAIMVGTGLGADNGILIKSGEFLELANKIDFILFDKTGTLTSGDFKITKLELLGAGCNYRLDQIWKIIGELEKNSEHPVAKSLYKESLIFTSTESDDIEILIKEISFQASMGVVANVLLNGEENIVKMGNRKLISNCTAGLDDDSGFAVVPEIQSTAVHISINDKYIGFVELCDEIKKEAYDTMTYLITQGDYKIGMVTGDNMISAQHTSELLNVQLDAIYANKTPTEKAEVVESLQNQGYVVAFIGDGTNDAPALIQADLGIAMSSGTDIAIESADVVLLDHDLTNVVKTLDISIQTFQRIKINFIWAIVYNLIMLPFAMGVFIIPFGMMLDPMIASLSMAFSSVSVVLSSLMLKRWRNPMVNNRTNNWWSWSWSWLPSWVSGKNRNRRADYLELQTMA